MSGGTLDLHAWILHNSFYSTHFNPFNRCKYYFFDMHLCTHLCGMSLIMQHLPFASKTPEGCWSVALPPNRLAGTNIRLHLHSQLCWQCTLQPWKASFELYKQTFALCLPLFSGECGTLRTGPRWITADLHSPTHLWLCCGVLKAQSFLSKRQIAQKCQQRQKTLF